MEDYSKSFWEACWKRGAAAEYGAYLAKYDKKQDPVVDLLKQYHVRRVCDAACGFGAYSLLLLSNGFQVEGFDISQTSVEIARSLLAAYGFDTSWYRVASVLNTGYDKTFDAVTACSVLDHLYRADAEKALKELLRIVKDGGILVVSFDGMDEEDLKLPHVVTEDGSILYQKGRRSGMVYHFYSDGELTEWLGAYSVVLTYTNDRGERFYAIQK